jgi:chromosome partitioning protein
MGKFMTSIVGVISQKGGVLKSSICRALACAVSSQGLSVKVGDLDIQQATTTNWLRRRLEADIQPVFSVEPFKQATQAIKESTNYDLLILDGPARASAGTLDIANHSDLIVQPTGPSLDDMEPAVNLFHELRKKGIDRSNLVFVLTRVSTESEVRYARDYLEEAGYKVLDGAIYERPSCRQAQDKGYALNEVNYEKIKETVEVVLQSLINEII